MFLFCLTKTVDNKVLTVARVFLIAQAYILIKGYKMKKVLDNKIVWFMVIVIASPFILLEKILKITGVMSVK